LTTLVELSRKISLCRECGLAEGRTNAVPGEGDPNADIMFIGEAPGFHEDQQGRPFVGAAGKFLDQLIDSIGLDRSQVYIANIIKCRPPNNRDPLPDEVDICRKWLSRQTEIISPRVIVTLGRHSMARFFPDATIGKVHGTAKNINGQIYFAMYHPAAALHQQSLKKTIEADMLKLPEILSQLDKDAKPNSNTKADSEQLSMF